MLIYFEFDCLFDQENGGIGFEYVGHDIKSFGVYYIKFFFGNKVFES